MHPEVSTISIPRFFSVSLATSPCLSYHYSGVCICLPDLTATWQVAAETLEWWPMDV